MSQCVPHRQTDRFGWPLSLYIPGNTNFRGRLSTLDLLAPTSLVLNFGSLSFFNLLSNMSLLRLEVNCTEPFPLVSIPWKYLTKKGDRSSGKKDIFLYLPIEAANWPSKFNYPTLAPRLLLRYKVILKPRLHEQWCFRFLSWLTNFARLSDRFWDRNFPVSPSDFVQFMSDCDVRRSDAYKNQTDGLAKSVRQ